MYIASSIWIAKCKLYNVVTYIATYGITQLKLDTCFRLLAFVHRFILSHWSKIMCYLHAALVVSRILLANDRKSTILLHLLLKLAILQPLFYVHIRKLRSLMRKSHVLSTNCCWWHFVVWCSRSSFTHTIFICWRWLLPPANKKVSV